MLKLTEEQLAERVVGYLQDLQWEVYQEVTVRGSIADIVAVQGPQVWVVECKTSFGLKVCSQAFEWRRFANRVSVAVGYRHFSRFEKGVLKNCGVGALTVGDGVREVLAPELCRKPAVEIRKRLVEKHKTYAKAGNARGHRWTPFQETCDEVRHYVERNPGCSLKDMLASIRTHYQSTESARNSLRKWIEVGKVRGVRLEREGRLLKLYANREEVNRGA